MPNESEIGRLLNEGPADSTEIFARPDMRAEYDARTAAFKARQVLGGGGIANVRLGEVGRVSAAESTRAAIVAEPGLAPKGNVQQSPNSR